jgi:signal transduction histidine kinase
VAAPPGAPQGLDNGAGAPGGAPPRPGAAAPSPHRASRYPLKNWRVRSRLLLLITAPTLAALALGGLSVSSSVRNALAYARVQQTASLANKITSLVQALQTERTDTVRFITMGSLGGRDNALSSSAANRALAKPELDVLSLDWKITDRQAAGVRDLAGNVDGSFPLLAQQEAQDAITVTRNLSSLREAATHSQLPSVVVVEKYKDSINKLLTLENEIAAGSSNATLADTVRVVGLISNAKEEASEQQALLTSALTSDLLGAGQLGPVQLSALNNAAAQQSANLSAFNLSATPAQRALYEGAVSSAVAARAQQQVSQAVQLQANGPVLSSNPIFVNAANGSSYTVASLRKVEQSLMSSVLSQSSSLRGKAITAAALGGIAAAIVLALALLLTALVGRSMIRPLRRLRAGALEVAGLRLPETVRRMSETDGAGVSLDIKPIDVDSIDEIGEVARAFDQVHREAIRLAANEAAVRGNVNAMFVNLSRRSQSLIERQIQLIDELEQGEQDPEQLSSLFQMDHLATRMRRNSENLLVLAGHDLSRRWNQPIVLVDVLRAAVSEIEQYARVTLNVQAGIAVRGHAVNDVVHLLAELAENATAFSSADTPVTISGHLLNSGGVLLDITDQGVGMGAEEMAHANWRLDNPPVVDVAVSRRMGLFVVARLAARHGIRVRLRPATSGGLTALVWLPDEVVSQDGTATPSGSRMPDESAGGGGTDMFGGLADFDAAQWTDERAATAQEVSAARTPKFAALSDGGENGLGRRVPRTGSGTPATPRGAATTGPLPAFRTSPAPANGSDDEIQATGPIQAVGDQTGPVPAISADTFSGWPEPAGSSGTQAPAGGSTGNGQQLPKRRVKDADDSAAAATAGTSDLFSPSGSSGINLFDPGQSRTAPAQPDDSTGSFRIAEPVGPVEPAEAPSAPEPVFNAPTAVESAWGTAPPADDVVLPAAAQPQEYRLPIFEAVESDWFRRGRSSVGWSPQEQEAAETVSAAAPAGGWSSPADEGWQAAAAAAAPSSGGVTTAGLPKRVPRANLVPGTAAAETSAPTPARSAQATRDRFASFQRGIREGRAAASNESASGGEDDGSR